jgi:hypothetical protein
MVIFCKKIVLQFSYKSLLCGGPTKRVWVNQWLYFSLSATDFPLHFPLSTPMLLLSILPQCYIGMLPAGGEGGVRRRKAESTLMLAESRAVDLP